MVVTLGGRRRGTALRPRVAGPYPGPAPGRAGAPLLAGWLVALLLGLSEGNHWGWTSPEVLGLFAVAVVLGAAWVAVEMQVPVPLIDMQMMRRRGIWTSNVVAGCVGFGMFASFGFLPQLSADPARGGATGSAPRSRSRATCCCLRRWPASCWASPPRP